MSYTKSQLMKAVLSNIKIDLAVGNPEHYINNADVQEAIDNAKIELESNSPYLYYESITGDGTKDYVLDADFYERDFSQLDSVEFPYGETPPKYRTKDEVFYYYDATKSSTLRNRLRFYSLQPAATQTIVVSYTARHTITGVASACTLTREQFLGFVYQATRQCLMKMANQASQSHSPMISADTVDIRLTSREFSMLADKWHKKYLEIIGIGRETKADQHVTEVDINRGDGTDYIYHSHYRR